MERLDSGLNPVLALGVRTSVLAQETYLRVCGFPKFQYTNESLEAIVAGLDVCEDDSVLAICGSGDQAFAILESARQVLATDVDQAQIQYAQKRANLLRLGRFDEFLAVRPTLITTTGISAVGFQQLAIRNRYFRVPERLVKIGGKLDNLEFMRADIADMKPKAGRFSKIYLSNVVSIDYSQRALRRYSDFLEGLSNFLPEDGLIYLSNYDQIQKDACWVPLWVSHPPSLQICERLTRLAGEREEEVKGHWNPIVYRKVNR